MLFSSALPPDTLAGSIQAGTPVIPRSRHAPINASALFAKMTREAADFEQVFSMVDDSFSKIVQIITYVS